MHLPRFPLLALLCLAAALPASLLRAQDDVPPPPLVGKIEGSVYVSPTGAFKVQIPVLPELGGGVTDTENVVTFQDQFNVHASIACFPMDATQRWENETRGRKDYLVWFFGNFVQADFKERYPGASLESARFLPSVNEGTLLVYNLLPGGSMFEDRIILTAGEEFPTAKRGNLVFVKGQFVFVVSIELAEKVLERRTYSKTAAEEDEILRKRLLDLTNKLQFTGPAAVSAPTAAPAAASAPAPAPSDGTPK